MIIVRNTFTAKPGQAGKLLAQMKDVATAGKLRNLRFFTDLAGDFNQVVMEHEVDSLADFEAVMQRYATDPEIREKSKGYTEYWLTGKREFFRLA
jgi:NIPSNAP